MHCPNILNPTSSHPAGNECISVLHGVEINYEENNYTSSYMLLYQSLAVSQIIHPQNRAIVAFHANVIEDSHFHFLYSYEITNQESSAEAFDSFTLLLADSLLAYDYTTVHTPTNKKWYIDGDGSIGSVSGAAASRFLTYH